MRIGTGNIFVTEWMPRCSSVKTCGCPRKYRLGCANGSTTPGRSRKHLVYISWYFWKLIQSTTQWISEESRLIDKLPLKLQTDLAISVHYQTLSKVQLFQVWFLRRSFKGIVLKIAISRRVFELYFLLIYYNILGLRSRLVKRFSVELETVLIFAWRLHLYESGFNLPKSRWKTRVFICNVFAGRGR